MPTAAITTIANMYTFARTLWGEARGESEEGQIAVAWVIVNRANAAKKFYAKNHRPHPLYGTGNIASACLVNAQFSCWSKAEFNRKNLEDMLAVTFDNKKFLKIFANNCLVLGGYIPDPTGGATHYNTKGVDPAWDDKMTQTIVIGNHEFFK